MQHVEQIGHDRCYVAEACEQQHDCWVSDSPRPASLVVPPATTPPKATPVPTRAVVVREGLASYYGADFQGKRTASGVKFDMNAMVAAHPSYPLGTVVRVTNLKNRRSVQVQILDRGPAAGPRADGVIIDLSRRAAQELGFIKAGRTRVRLEVLRWGSPSEI